jgi:uridine kinase
MYHPNFRESLASSPYIFALGVASDSGSGKTTFTEGIRNIFGDDLVYTIPLDDYHSLDREGRHKHRLTNGQRMGEMIIDGELSEHVIKNLNRASNGRHGCIRSRYSKTGPISPLEISHN